MKLQLTKEIQAKVMWQTYMIIALQCQRLNLTIGEVIDRAVLEVVAKTPETAAIFVCEQFAIATSMMSDEDVEKALITGIALLVNPLLQADMSEDEIWGKVLDAIEDLSLD